MRLPTLGPIDGSTFDTTLSNNATTDFGSARTTTEGTDGGWRDGSGAPVSEMGHMDYVTPGDLGYCTRNDADPSICDIQTEYGLGDTGPFSGVQPSVYFSDTQFEPGLAWIFHFGLGELAGESTPQSGLGYYSIRRVKLEKPAGELDSMQVSVIAALFAFGPLTLGLELIVSL